MKTFNRQTGRLGEEIALQNLLARGYELVERNYSTKFGEIDLIMKDKSVLVFVEVKTKKGLDFGSPEEMFTRGKREKVKRMATVFLDGKEVACRIDMIAVVLDSQNEVVSVKHYLAV
ncbi:MAG: YraN family protein [Patescibacteria group bacterium]